MKNRRRDDRAGRTRKRPTARRHLVQDEPEREEIRARIERFTAQLLRRHVRHGADRDAAIGEVCHDRLRYLPRYDLGRERGLGHAEVENLRPAGRQEDIGGLDVAMDDAGAVGSVERVGKREARIHKQRHL